MSRPAPWELDPTYLEQTGLDPQQLWRQARAEVRQSASQTQSAPSSSPLPPPSSSSSPATAAPSSPSPPPSSPPPPPSPPPSKSTSTGGSSTRRPEPWRLDPTYLEQTGLDPEQVRREIETAVRQSTASRGTSATQQTDSSAQSRNASPDADGSSTRKPEPWRLDPTYLERTGLDPESVGREIDAAVRQIVSQKLSTSGSAQPSRQPSSQPDFSTLLDVSALAMALRSLSDDSASRGRTSANAGIIPVDYLLDQRKDSTSRGMTLANAGGASTLASSSRRPEPWMLDPTYLEQTGLDPRYVWRELDAAVRQIASQQRQSAPTPADGSRRSLAPAAAPSLDPSALLDVSALAMARRASYEASSQQAGDRQRVDNVGVVPVDYLLDQRNPVNIALAPAAAPSLDPSALLDVSALAMARRASYEASSQQAGDRQRVGNVGVVPVDYLLDQRNPVNIVNRLTTALEHLWRELDWTVYRYGDVLQYSGSDISMSPQLQDMLDRYSAALDELKESLPDAEKVLRDMFGDYVVVSGGEVDLAPELKEMLQRLDEFSTAYNYLMYDYKSALDELAKRYNLKEENGMLVFDFDKVKPELEALNQEYKERLESIARKYGLRRDENGRLIADPEKYEQVRAELEALDQWYESALNEVLNKYNLKVTDDGWIVFDYDKVRAELEALDKKYSEALDKLYDQYRDVVNKRVVDGKVVYELKPEVQAALVLQGQVAQVVSELAAAQRQALQDIVSRYGDVLSYDETTGKITPSKELEEMINRYTQAAQEVRKITAAMSAVAGMLPAVAQQMPVITVKFQAYDKATNQFVKTGGETPIYVRDENMRREIVDWLKQNEGSVRVAAFYDPNKPVVYVFNDRDEGYIIFPATGEARRARGVSGMVDDTAKAMWYKSLTDRERKELEQYYKLQWEKEQTKQTLQNLPPVVRELYGALITAGQYAPISSSVDIVARAVLGREDPLAGVKKVHALAEAVKDVSPAAYYAGTGVGLAGLVGLGAEAILARGAAKLAGQGAKNVVEDITKFAAVKKPEFPVPSPIQYVQQTAKAPTLLQTAAAGLKDAAVPMGISGVAFGGLEGVKSYLEEGKVDVSRVLQGAAFGSLMGAFPITKTQALAALGIGAGAVAGSHLIRGYDLATSLAVGEAAGLSAVVGGGLKRMAETSGVASVKAPEVKITDFAVVMRPEGGSAPRVDLSGVDFVKKLSSAVGNTVADVVSGRITVEEANLRLGAIRDAVPDKALFDKILQSYKTLSEPPKAPTADFATAAKKAAEVISAADSGKVPVYRAFIELAGLRASVADKAHFDKMFGAKLREYGEQYVQWLLNSGLDKPSAVLQLSKHEAVLGRQLIERYVPDYGKVLAEIEAKLSQLHPVSPREAPAVRLTPEEVFARVRSLFDAVVEGRMDWFKASEELYKMWRDASPEVRTDIEATLNQLNRRYGEKYGVTLEPWRPSLLERALRTAELFAAGVRSAVANALRAAEELLSPRHIAHVWRRTRVGALDRKLYNIADSFMSGRISLEEAKKALAELAGRYEKFGMEEMARAIREKLKDDEMLKRFLDAAHGLHRGSKLKSTVWVGKSRLRGTVDKVVDAARDLVPEYRRYTWRGWRFTEAEGRFADLVSRFERGEVSLETARREISKLIKEIEKTHGREIAEGYRKYFEEAVLKMEFNDVVGKFRRGEMSLEEARAKLMEIVDKIEKTLGKEKADLYRKYAEEVLTGKRAEERKHAEEKPRLPDEKDVEWIKRAEEERRRMEQKKRGEGSGRGQQQLLLLKKESPVGEKVRAKLMWRSRRVTPLEKPIRSASASEAQQSPAAETAPRQVLTPEERSALVQALKARAEVIPEVATSPVMQQMRKVGLKKTAVINKLVKSPRIIQRLKEEPPPKRRRKRIAVPPLVSPKTPPQYTKPWIAIPKTPKHTLPYEPMSVSTTAMPPTAGVPPLPTYTPLDVPQLTTYDVPTVPTYTTPTYTTPTYTTPTVYEISEVPTYGTSPMPRPKPLPYGWWHLLPPSVFFADRTGEGAYKVQEGKRQILLLA